MSNQFYPGQKVVCVNAHGSYAVLYGLKEGSVYTVSFIANCCTARIGVEETSWSGEHTACPYCGHADTYEGVSWQSVRFAPHEPLKEEMDRIESEGAPAQLETVEAIDHTHPEWCDSSDLTLEELTNPATWPPIQH